MKQIYTLPLAILAFTSQLLLLTPLAMYAGNALEFSQPFSLLLFKNALLVILLVGLAYLLAAKRQPAEWPKAITFFAGFSLLAWIQVHLLVADYGILNGLNIEWEKHDGFGYLEIAVWILCIAVFSVLCKKGKSQLVLKAALFVLVVQILSSVVAISSLPERDRDTVVDASVETIFEFSKTDNVIHILMDGFQADVFGELMAHPRLSPYYQDAFSGFHFFSETLGVFPYTQFAVPALMTGQVYRNEEVKEVFIDRVMGEQSIPGAAYENGYRVDLAISGSYFRDRYKQIPHTNLMDIDNIGQLSPKTREWAELMDLSLFRIAPHFLKPFIYNDQKWRVKSLVQTSGKPQRRYFKHQDFLLNMAARATVNVDQPVYKYIHVMNTHNPMLVNEQCEYAGKTMPATRYNLTVQSKCTMDMLSHLLNRLKELGIYDSSMIIIHGDHGGWAGNRVNSGEIVFPDGQHAPPWLASLASPLLAIKPPHSEGFTVSQQLVSLADIPDTISAVKGFGKSFGHQSAFAVQPDEARQRRFYFYPWQEGEWDKETVEIIFEFLVTGSHYTTDWKLEKIYYPYNDKNK